ncbi:hypothetical protein OTU49_004864 [Cherax quadricarinatus]|uniref:Poly [ADP-ribose] polymerase 12 n=2 Tax=Cherax quadricarinatus TaxID=27406 RepID=A0AAW0X9E9_CHEQU
MCDRGSGRGYGRGRGRGRGRGMHNFQQTMDANFQELDKNTRLLRVISDTVNALLPQAEAVQRLTNQNVQNKRGSQSMMNLSCEGNQQFNRSSNQRQSHRGFSRRGGRGNYFGCQNELPQQQRQGNHGPGQPLERNRYNHSPSPSYCPPLNERPPHYQPHSWNSENSHYRTHKRADYHPQAHISGNFHPATQNWGKNKSSSDYQNSEGQNYQTSQYGPPPWHESKTGQHCNPSPPPSYEESVGENYNRKTPSAPPLMDIYEDNDSFQQQRKEYGPKKNQDLQDDSQKMGHISVLSPAELVKILSHFNGQWSTVETLSKQVQRSVDEIMRVVKSHKDIFSYMGVEDGIAVELVPKIRLCSEYFTANGCLALKSCSDIHMCKFFVIGFCEAGVKCRYGHKWDTDHNSAILSKLYLDVINKSDLYHLMRKVCKGNVSLQICEYYNRKRGCMKNEGCSRLHICKEYLINGGKCLFQNCSFNHDVFNGHCKRLLKRYGISTNESQRDILLNILSSIRKENDDQLSSVSSGNLKMRRKKKATNSDENGSGSETSCDEDSSDSSSDSDSQYSNVTHKRKGKETSRKVETNIKREKEHTKMTVQSTDVYGDVEVPAICIYAINDKCLNTNKGCKYLHAKSNFHWQFQKANKWYNFRIFHSKALETAYRDASKDKFQMPTIDTNISQSCAKEILNILGTKSWIADFKDMSIEDSSGTQLKIRRVSTRSAGESKSPNSTVYDWFFLDEQGKWICYGEVDSLGKQELACSTTSDSIEKQYLSDPSSSMLISNIKFTYKLNFAQMTQTNMKTNKVREIRRRPSQIHSRKKTLPDKSQNCLPSHWIPMSANQTHILVALNPNSPEYQKVTSRLRLTLPTVKVQKLQRLQNPYLWLQLENKKADLSRSYDENQLNMQKLFHGINSSLIDTICKENIDWRQGGNAQQDFGQGTYFSNSAAIARSSCTRDVNGHFILILAEVIIGTVAKGSPTLTRPPTNNLTNTMYDTTVDNVYAPNIFVKYEKMEYYPEYIIEFC